MFIPFTFLNMSNFCAVSLAITVCTVIYLHSVNKNRYDTT